MDKLKKLELNKLISELEFIRSDYEYKTEVIQKADKEFIESVNHIVDSHPELKKIYDQKFQKVYQEKVKINVQENVDIDLEPELESEINIEEIQTQHKDPKLKNIYRNIVKKTHPDKIDDNKLNEIYLQSTKFYEQNDLLSLYRICDKLNINYDLEENDYFLLQSKISELREKVKFLESTFTWMWINSQESQKEDIVLSFVRLQIG